MRSVGSEGGGSAPPEDLFAPPADLSDNQIGVMEAYERDLNLPERQI
jgi:hypothetical protein